MLYKVYRRNRKHLVEKGSKITACNIDLRMVPTSSRTEDLSQVDCEFCAKAISKKNVIMT